MALKNIMNAGGSLGHKAGSQMTGGSFTISSTPSTKVKAGGQGVYRGTLSFSFSGGTYPGGVPGSASGSGSINPTATKVKADGQLVIRKDDEGTMSGTMTNPSPPPPTLPWGPTSVVVSDAGQTKASGQ